MTKNHCCKSMTQAIKFNCDKHKDPYECPDTLIVYKPKFDEYGLIIHDGGTSSLSIYFCPFCGIELPKSKRDLWFQKLKELGYEDPASNKIPKEFKDLRWTPILGPQLWDNLYQ